MAYSGVRRPDERAAKLGYIPFLQDPNLTQSVKNLAFSSPRSNRSPSASKDRYLNWEVYEDTAEPLRRVVAVDGSYAPISAQGCSFTFVKVAAIDIVTEELERLNGEVVHPLLLSRLLARGTAVHLAALPVSIFDAEMRDVAELLGRTIFETMRTSLGGELLETYRWLVHRLWSSSPIMSPSFMCPCCGRTVPGFSPGEIERICPNPGCGKRLFVTDVAEWDRDLSEDGNPEKLGSRYMLFSEVLLLFTKIRQAMDDDTRMNETLFSADGALAMNERFCRFVPSVRALIQFLSDTGRGLYICGVEKSGAIQRHVVKSARNLEPCSPEVRFAVLDRRYIGEHIKNLHDRKNIYGKRENYGEKVGVSVGEKATLLLNVPTKIAKVNPRATKDDLYGLDRILATVSSLVTAKYENAVVQTSIANAMSSIAVYPSRRILTQFLSEILADTEAGIIPD